MTMSLVVFTLWSIKLSWIELCLCYTRRCKFARQPTELDWTAGQFAVPNVFKRDR